MTNHVVLRRARRGEMDDLNRLIFRSKAHWGYDAAFMDACRNELRLPPTVHDDPLFLVATRAERPAGCIKVSIHENIAEIDLLYVDPVAIGTGVGRALMAFADAEAAREGCTAIEVTADPNAAQFYGRMGYELIGEAPSGSIPDRSLPRLRRPIESGARDV